MIDRLFMIMSAEPQQHCDTDRGDDCGHRNCNPENHQKNLQRNRGAR